jgi:pyruvate,water dikinase
MTASRYVLDFGEITLAGREQVGGKNSSLGQLFNTLGPLGVGVLDGFATTAAAYRRLLATGRLEEKLRGILSGFDPEDVKALGERGHAARAAILDTPLPEDVAAAILDGHERLVKRLGRDAELAVRSSATAEDLPEASFAGQQETYLNVRGRDALLRAVHACFASLFTDRAINYRARHGFDHMQVALSAGVQPMVRSDLGSAGVIFTLDPESGFRDATVVTGSYGLGELVVQGVVTPDEWTVFKPTLAAGKSPIIGRRLGTKEVRLVYAGGSRGTRSETTPERDRRRYCLSDAEVLELARWSSLIEEHYSESARRRQPMDLEWAKDGSTGKLFILQARPETVHSAKPAQATLEVYRLKGARGAPILRGQAVGEKIGAGRVRVVRDTRSLAAVEPGEILVARMTDPDWEPVMKRVSAIVTDHGGRTAHAAIVSRELGLPCIVGTGRGTDVLRDGETVTVSCAEGSEGQVHRGAVAFEVERIDASKVPETRTAVLLNVGDPSQAFRLSMLPAAGVGLARIEFIITNHIGIHPMALARYPALRDPSSAAEVKARIGDEDPREFFVRRLSEGIGRIAAAFFPRPVIVRTSDFKTNEYARLAGGAEFEPDEENPMIGFRGASRYYDPRYAEGFALECAALRRVREDMGLTNVKVMIPFCRTLQEGERVIAELSRNGLRRGENGLEVYAMCELPSNAIQAEEFLGIFDGFSIGSNDLTQLVLGIDRDSGTVAHLFDERDTSVRRMIALAIEAAARAGKPIGICGQAPSDYPEFAGWLVERGIGSISLNPDAVVKTKMVISSVEQGLAGRRPAPGSPRRAPPGASAGQSVAAR